MQHDLVVNMTVAAAFDCVLYYNYRARGGAEFTRVCQLCTHQVLATKHKIYSCCLCACWHYPHVCCMPAGE